MSSPRSLVSRRVAASTAAMRPFLRFLHESAYAQVRGQADICDFVFGNPQDMPLAGFVEAMRRWIEPKHKNWYAYTDHHPGARQAIARRLCERRGLPFEPEDVFMTPGSFGAIAVAFATFLDPGDEVIYSLPPWFCYESMLAHLGAKPVKVSVRADDFDLDVSAIAAAITERTRMVIVNTPNNPTGRIYTPDTLRRLADVLTQASERYGAIYLLSDESYNRVVFPGNQFHSPAEHYSRTLINYTYGKILLNPGARLGYLASSPHMPERQTIREAVYTVQCSGGWLFPNAVLQYAVDELEDQGLDLHVLADKRDRMLTALRAIGYQVHEPEGTFYLLPKSPIADDEAFTRLLCEHNIYVLPGTVCEIPGYFRISLTANQEMIENSLAGFAAAFNAV